MKKIYGFLTAAAILLTAACTQDLDGPNKVDGSNGDMFMSIQIAPTGPIGTRTPTGDGTNPGKEVGKDRENKISTALVIFAEKDNSDNYKVVTSVFSGNGASEFQLTGNPQGSYMATFMVDRNKLLEDIGEEKVYYIFVIANAGSLNSTLLGTEGLLKKGTNVQQVFETASDAATYWQADNFLMTNANVEGLTITAESIKKGTHIVATDPFPLGTINVQRAMSRFDLATASKYTKFTATTEGREDDDLAEGNSDLKDLTIEFESVALINMAQKANMFKVTAANATTLGDKTILFGTETSNNWVFSPVQTAFSAPLFAGAPNTTGLQTGTTVTDGLESFFGTEAPEDETNHIAVNRVGGYTTMANLALSETENEWSKDPSDKPERDVPTYKIWRYCMENTNPDNVDNQKNGNTTGVVFRAQITGKKINGEPLTATDGALYAYNSVILGNAEALRTYVVNSKPSPDDAIYDVVKLKYESAVAAYNESGNPKFTFEVDKTGEGDWSAPDGSELKQGYKDIRKASADELAGLDPKLVTAGFSIYRPTSNDAQGKYYCYYIYWNRHNDNLDNSQMGPMEFATVRNNIYKLRVTKIHKLGHPGKPEDDPDNPKPDDPDEKDSFYCQVICEILPWEVRLNDIEF